MPALPSSGRRRHGRDRRQSGFTITELLVVIVIIGVLAAVAFFGARRPLDETQLSAAAGNFRWTLNSARQRAITTHTPYLVEISRSRGYRFCTLRLPQTNPPACSSTGELGQWVAVGDRVVIEKYAKAVHIGGAVVTTALGASTTVPLLVAANGIVDGDPATSTSEGFTLYLRTTDNAKFRRIYLYPLTGQNRVIDRW